MRLIELGVVNPGLRIVRIAVDKGPIGIAPGPHHDELLQPVGGEVFKLPGPAPVAFEAVIDPGAAVGGGHYRPEVQPPLQKQGNPQQEGQKA